MNDERCGAYEGIIYVGRQCSVVKTEAKYQSRFQRRRYAAFFCVKESIRGAARNGRRGRATLSLSLVHSIVRAVMMAELIKHFRPKLVEMHNYTSANSTNQKKYNWATLKSTFRSVPFLSHLEASPSQTSSFADREGLSEIGSKSNRWRR